MRGGDKWRKWASEAGSKERRRNGTEKGQA